MSGNKVDDENESNKHDLANEGPIKNRGCTGEFLDT